MWGELRNRQRYVLSYAIAVSITIIIFVFLGEVRVDVYISMYILEYFIFTAIYGPFPRKVEARLRLISVILIIIFSIIVTYRVIEILFPHVLYQVALQ